MGALSLSEISILEPKVVIGSGGLAVSTNGAERLATYALGSSLGVTIYDPVSRVGGMLHAMLPDSSSDSIKAAAQPGMFVDSGISALFRAACKLGLDKSRARICVAGGAGDSGSDGFPHIGLRNYEKLKSILSGQGLAIDFEDVGGMVSRAISLNLTTGEVRLRTSGQEGESTLAKGMP